MRGTIAISTSPRTWLKHDPPLQRDLWRDHSTCLYRGCARLDTEA